ncbi:hypothetical protein Cgig2_031459 [Carnegiea gigantea]|uniref:RING-type E3 ubiquitin transferase n=1 Tax=Carnegiea gigantea TaxID=171969 RepID=A0A9Q1K7T3_9CARY|nr:hypothetical protein Cgig2_031459 [Carnegiea gigantea]
MTTKPEAPPQQQQLPPGESINRLLAELCVSDDCIPWDAPRRFVGYGGRLRLLMDHLHRLPAEVSASPSVQTALKGIVVDLAKAAETVSVYRERSKIYVLINCRSLCSALQDRTVTENEERVYCTLQREGQGKPATRAVQSAIVMDLARALGIDPSNHTELSKHVKFLKNDLARSNSVSERWILISLERIVDSLSVRSNISALDLGFDVEDDSQILPFKNFLCPLTKEVMKEPVVLESSQTYEQTAIEYWFQRCLEDGRDPTCPVTGQILSSLERKPNIGLAGAIEEWVNRNIEIQINLSVKYLREDPPMLDHVERVMINIYKISERHPSSRYKIRNADVVVLIITLLKNYSKNISSILKTKAFMALLSMAKDEDSKKTMLGEGITKLAINSLAGNSEEEKENALKLLLEFSRDEAYRAKIASEKGAFLLLSSVAENLEHPALSHLAEDVLKHLEMVDENVEHLAAAGRFEPLLSRLCEGSDSVQIEMASLLGKMTLTSRNKEKLARQTAEVLAEMLHKTEGRRASLLALHNLSSLDDNATILVESSVLQAVTDIILKSQDASSEQMELAAAIIANIVSNPGHWELAAIDKEGHSMHSSFATLHLMQLLSQVTPQCQVSVLQILCGIASSPKAAVSSMSLQHWFQVAAQIKSTDGLRTIIQFLERSETELRIVALKLTRVLSESCGIDLLEELRRRNKLAFLTGRLQDDNSTTGERSDASCILANLPLSENEVREVLGSYFLKWTIITLKEQRIPNGRTSRSSASMAEGLLGLLLHFARCTHPQTVSWVKENHLMAIFRDQLSILSHPRCKQLAVLGLKHLSESGRALVLDGESELLPPQGFCVPVVLICGRATPKPLTCPIHNAPCQEDSQLCLLRSDCIKPLIDLVFDEQTEVQIAVVEALSTLIPDSSHFYRRSIDELDRLGVVDAVINLFINVRPGELQEKTIWMVERSLRGESTSQRLALNESLVRALVEALKHGNASTRTLARDALTNLRQISGASGKISGPIRLRR